MPTMKEQKAAARKDARARRQAIPYSVKENAGSRATEHFMAAIPLPASSIVSVYWPLADEFDSRPLMHALTDTGHTAALPQVVGAGLPLVFRAWRPGDTLTEAALGVMEPSVQATEVQPNVVVAPYLACNAKGFRLGYGGGYYDRTIRALRQSVPGLLAVGLGFAAQLTASLPYEETDEQLDWLINETEARCIERP